jgi:hypothetical protein
MNDPAWKQPKIKPVVRVSLTGLGFLPWQMRMSRLHQAPCLDYPGVPLHLIAEVWYNQVGSAGFHHLDADEAILLVDQPICHRTHV